MGTYSKAFDKLKDKHPGAVLLFRNGEMLEAFGDDAKTVADVIGTQGDASQIAVACFSVWDIDKYIPAIIRKGRKVVFCDPIVSYI